MSTFAKIISEALARGDNTSPQFRKSVYETFLRAFEKTADKNPDPAGYRSKYKEQIDTAILNIEREFQDISIAPANDDLVQSYNSEILAGGNVRPEIEPISPSGQNPAYLDDIDVDATRPDASTDELRLKNENKASSGKKWIIAVAVCAVLLMLAYAGYIFFNSSPTSNKPMTTGVSTKDAQISETAPAPNEVVKINVGNGYTTSGEAKWLDVDGIALLTDSSKETIDLHQWIISRIPANEKHQITMTVQPRQAEIPYLQLQAVYSAQGKPTRNYVYVLNLAGGTIDGKGEDAFADRKMKKNSDGDFVFEAETENLDAEANLQIIIMPVLKTNATGAAFISNLTVEKASR